MNGPENIQVIKALRGTRRGPNLIEFNGNQRSEVELDGKFFHYKGTLKDKQFELEIFFDKVQDHEIFIGDKYMSWSIYKKDFMYEKYKNKVEDLNRYNRLLDKDKKLLVRL